MNTTSVRITGTGPGGIHFPEPPRVPLEPRCDKHPGLEAPRPWCRCATCRKERAHD